MNITFLVSKSTPPVCTTHLVFFFQQKKWLRPFTTEMKKQIVKGYWRNHQADMRNHLLKCFTARKFTPFPTSIVRRECNPRIIQLKVFCCCQMPATYGDMVQCGRCEQWFHIKCVGLPSLPCSDEEWNCSLCA